MAAQFIYYFTAPAHVTSVMKRSYKKSFGASSSSNGGGGQRRRVAVRRPQATSGFRPQVPAARIGSNAIEKKYIDTEIDYADLTTQWQVHLCNGVATGDSYDTRDGRKTVVKSIQIKGGFHPSDTTVSDRVHRCILFIDKQNNSNDPTGAGAAATAEMTLLLRDPTDTYSMLNPVTSGRFQVLKDWTFSLNGTEGSNGNDGIAPKFKDIKLYKKLNIPVMYSGTGATAASINDKAIYLAMMDSVATGLGSRVSMDIRVRFLDV